MHPFHHAASSARLHGGRLEDYLPLHCWFDASKAGMPDSRHRAIRHHVEGIAEAQTRWGEWVCNTEGRRVAVQQLSEQHVLEDLGRIPTAAEWLAEVSRSPMRSETGSTEAEGLVRRFGGRPQDYESLQAWFEAPAQSHPQGRLFRYHAEGIFWAEEALGFTLTIDGKPVPVRAVAEHHVRMVIGRIPVLADWLRGMRLMKWMSASPAAFRESLAEVDAYLQSLES